MPAGIDENGRGTTRGQTLAVRVECRAGGDIHKSVKGRYVLKGLLDKARHGYGITCRDTGTWIA